MKETLDEQSRISLVHYRMERADEAIEEAALMSMSEHYNAAVNRLYYARYKRKRGCVKIDVPSFLHSITLWVGT